MGFDKCRICIHHCSVVQNPYCTCSSLPTTCPLYLSLPTDLLTVSIVFFFCLFQNIIELESYRMQPSQIGFFHLVICAEVSLAFFCGSLAHFLYFLSFFLFLLLPFFLFLFLKIRIGVSTCKHLHVRTEIGSLDSYFFFI